ncbi:hypothetical protein [Endozoicomonas arenosclerae]|uniref:hypothetical protein n=1 Tax=Endozoicomonas arenosclerae TaxID=1633495 RepID=UPI00078066B4|nr:hypothetical protein [Endozoicomonas arenosclerae]
MKKIIVATGLLITALSTTCLIADDSKQLSTEIEATPSTIAMLDVRVGHIDVRPSKDNNIHVEVKIRESDEWFKDDIQKAELAIREKGDRILIEVGPDGKEYQEEWTVYLPAIKKLNLDVGVGEADIEDINTDMSVDVGVGSIKVSATQLNYSDVKAESGIGNTRISADTGKSFSERHLVGGTSFWEGSGQHSMSIDVGVGDASVKLK